MNFHTIKRADCVGPEGLCTLNDGTIAAIITDPPYEAEAHTKGRRIKAGKGTRRGVRDAPLPFSAMTEETRQAFAREAVRLCHGWCLVFGQVEALQAWRSTFEGVGARYVRTLLYVKSNPQPQLTGDRPGVGYEACFAFWLGKPGEMWWNGGGRCGVYYATSEWGHGRTAPHPTTKPIDLMEQLVRDFTRPGDVVLDPFAGSGTTVVAAKRLGRSGIGFESDARWADAAGVRVNAAREQLRMFEGTGT